MLAADRSSKVLSTDAKRDKGHRHGIKNSVPPPCFSITSIRGKYWLKIRAILQEVVLGESAVWRVIMCQGSPGWVVMLWRPKSAKEPQLHAGHTRRGTRGARLSCFLLGGV